MKQYRGILLAVLLCLSIGLAGCKAAPKIDLGKVEGNTYTHDYFGFTMELPEDWLVADEDELLAAMEAGADFMAEGNKEKGEAFDFASLKSLNLFLTYQYPLGTVGNPNIICVAEKVSILQGIKNSRDYLNIVKTQLEATSLLYTFGEFGEETLGGKQFSTLALSMDSGDGGQFLLKYYVTIHKGYALNLIIFYRDEGDLDTLNKALQSLSFR